MIFFISFYLTMMNISFYYKMSILNLDFISRPPGEDQIFFLFLKGAVLWRNRSFSSVVSVSHAEGQEVKRWTSRIFTPNVRKLIYWRQEILLRRSSVFGADVEKNWDKLWKVFHLTFGKLFLHYGCHYTTLLLFIRNTDEIQTRRKSKSYG